MNRFLSLVALLAVNAAALAAQPIVGTGPLPNLPSPVKLDTTGRFLTAYSKLGDDLYIAGQPTERALRELRAEGVTIVVNLRMPDEMTRVGFDEPALLEQLGIRYVHIPVRDGTANPYSPATVTAFAEVMAKAPGKVLLHCTVAWRASHLLAAYLIRERGVDEVTALTAARAINLMDDHRMTPDGKQPVEEFLGRSLPTLGRPAAPPASPPSPPVSRTSPSDRDVPLGPLPRPRQQQQSHGEERAERPGHANGK